MSLLFLKRIWAKLSSVYQKTEGPIPDIRGLPIVGTMFHIAFAGGAPKLHYYIDKRHKQYGHIFSENLGGVEEATFVSSAKLMEDVFKHEGRNPKHVLPKPWELYNELYKCERGLFFMDGEEWRLYRKKLSNSLVGSTVNLHVGEETDKLIKKWLNKSPGCGDEGYVGYVIENLEQQLYRWSIGIITSVMFGNTPELEANDIQQALDEFAVIVPKLFESTVPLMNIPVKLAYKCNMKIWLEFENSVREVMEKGSQLIDLFVKRTSYNPDGIYKSLLDKDISLEMIKRIFVDLVIAASDTTSYSTTWALYLLSKDKQLQERINQEYNGSHNTHLAKGLVRETQRLYPVAPFIGRYIPQDCTLVGGYPIKEGSLVLLSLFTAGRDEKQFSKPLEVIPERWIKSDPRDRFPHNFFLPFALGQRNCIGSGLALNQMIYMVAEMSKHFHLTCVNSSPVESVLSLITVPNQPIKLSIKKRIQ